MSMYSYLAVQISLEMSLLYIIVYLFIVMHRILTRSHHKKSRVYTCIYFIHCVKYKSLFTGEGVLGNILLEGWKCNSLVHTFQVSYLPQFNVCILFTCITFIFNHQTPCQMLQKLVFSLLREVRMLVQLEDATTRETNQNSGRIDPILAN